MKKKIAIVGGGIFGTTLALVLSPKYNVTLFEITNDVLTGATKKNQMRFHMGYHYPRSELTVKEINFSISSFLKLYGANILGKTKNFYFISNKDSKTNFKKYINFLKKNKLSYRILNSFFQSPNISKPILTEEKTLNFFKLKKIILKFLKIKKVNIKFNTSINKDTYANYDKFILCAYSNNNEVLKQLGYKSFKKYKFELVEKIIIKLPAIHENKSYIVLDGKFCCVDPYLDTGFHLLSDNKNSKIEIIENIFPTFKNKKSRFLKKGIIKNVKYSRFRKFINHSSAYLPFLKEAKYIGSFFVTRCIQINTEQKDHRNSVVEFYDKKKIITILSGKWNTAVFWANNIKKLIN
jgi:D-amino-acid oxidase